MRIIAGRLGGLRLTALGKGDEAAHLRPTTDRVRESLFGRLEGGRFGDPISDAVVLDLFAGTGALGLEALSRGAKSATFVDSGRVAGKLLQANVDKARVGDVCRILKRDVSRIGRCDGTPANLVFLDPPYGTGLGAKALLAATKGGWLAEDAFIVWEDASQATPPKGFELLEAARFGETWLNFLTLGDMEASVS